MHYKELIIFVKIVLRSRGERAVIESGNHFSNLVDSEGDKAIAEFG